MLALRSITMAFTPEETVWTPEGQAFGCIEIEACRGRTGVSPRMGGMALDCSHAGCYIKDQIEKAQLAMDADALAKLPVLLKP
jgi:hypothetical protein